MRWSSLSQCSPLASPPQRQFARPRPLGWPSCSLEERPQVSSASHRHDFTRTTPHDWTKEAEEQSDTRTEEARNADSAGDLPHLVARPFVLTCSQRQPFPAQRGDRIDRHSPSHFGRPCSSLVAHGRFELDAGASCLLLRSSSVCSVLTDVSCERRSVGHGDGGAADGGAAARGPAGTGDGGGTACTRRRTACTRRDGTRRKDSSSRSRRIHSSATGGCV